MKTFFVPFFSFIFFCISNCTTKEQKGILKCAQISPLSLVRIKPKTPEPSQAQLFRSEYAKIDTTTLAGKRELILFEFNMNGNPYSDWDSLFDLNYDGHDDYVLGFYYSAGTGLKHGVSVFTYDSVLNTYRTDTLLDGMANPSFYLNDQKITTFYFPNGGANGYEYCWSASDTNTNQWVLTKSVSGLNNEPELTDWIIEYHLTGEVDTIRDIYYWLPPDWMLENVYN